MPTREQHERELAVIDAEQAVREMTAARIKRLEAETNYLRVLLKQERGQKPYPYELQAARRDVRTYPELAQHGETLCQNSG